MIKKIGYIFSLFLIFGLSLEAKSLLYKVTTADNTVYILGSIHLAKPELYPLPAEIISAYEKSDVLVLELDPTSQVSMASIQEAMITQGSYPVGKSLHDELSQESYRLLTDYLQKVSIPVQSVQQMRPWLLTLSLSMIEMKRLGYSAELGIDQYFLHRAKAENKPVIELETAKEQMALLAKDDKSFQEKLLRYTLQSMHELEPMLETMFKSWQEGDAASFDKMMSMPLQSDPDLEGIYDDIMIKRNYKMRDRIKGFLNTGQDYFVVVGSGHVVGQEGIVSLLKAEGYKVIQR